MARSASVTPEMIAEAANALEAEGIKVTNRAVYERVGRIGSSGTISPLVSAWKEKRKKHVVSALTLPPALQKSILDFMASELARERQELESNLVDQQREITDLAQENEKQFAEAEDAAETIVILRKDIALLQGKTGQLETDIAKIHVEVVQEREHAELARTELAKAQLRLEAMPRLETDLHEARLSIETERTAKIGAEQAAAVALAKLDAATQRIQDLADRLAKAEAGNAKLQQKNDADTREAANLNSTIHTQKARLESAARELDDMKKLASDASALAKKSGEEAAELRGTIKQMHVDADATAKKSKE